MNKEEFDLVKQKMIKSIEDYFNKLDKKINGDKK